MMPRRLMAQVIISLTLAAALKGATLASMPPVVQRDAGAVLAWQYPNPAALLQLLHLPDVSALGLGAKQTTAHASQSIILAWPVSGPLLSDRHGVVRIAATQGTPVHAAASGQITAVTAVFGSGFKVTQSVHGGLQIIYAGLGPVTALRGNTVKKGALIGYVAHPRSQRPVLSLSVNIHGKSVDPISLLGK